ncbi:alginate lyase family protein [Oceanirhabdus seepicola]|uniref:Alginate lyase family protein n=1 Tax=Oceanirhabdus seepicola TaxID=2828781 RepID=A0A9J6P4G6_9CLOT|nr:alginate lyase family protein [Oceanirhabdus seepicola]MCM1990512.1 alginate lyase family protein [Oceanirhabdus seepicola]
MSKLKWLYCRLKAMSLGEILYRFHEKYKKIMYKKTYSTSKSVLEVNKMKITTFEDIDKRIENIFQVLEVEKHKFKSDISIYGDSLLKYQKINWHKGNNGREWPSEKSCFDISFKNREDIGEIRYTWEVNRFLFLPGLAIQYNCGGDKKVYDTLKNQFYSWIDENPFLKGVNWASPMEIALRSYQLLITYSQIKDKMDKQFKEDILSTIITSINYVAHNFSRFSSANNHLIVEAAITSIVGYCVEPVYAQNWFEKGYNVLKKEIPLQVYEDGVNKEQSMHYHAFVLDIMMQYNIFLKKIEREVLHEEIIFKMAEFIGYLYKNSNNIDFGDSDDAKILDLDGRDKNYYEYVLQLASVYYKKKLIFINEPLIEVQFLLGYLFDKIENEPYEYRKFKVYEKGGYSIINAKSNFLLFDSGALGFGSIAAHGHADALSLVYSHNKESVFVDSGTYIYNIQSKWRDYFRLTSNHNTLTTEKNQSNIQGPFLWSQKANVELVDYGEDSNLIYLYGKHDGYKPNIHHRAISYMKDEEIIIVEDEFKGKGILNYILDSNLTLEKINKNLVKINVGDGIYFYCSKPYKIVEKWISKSFLHKEKTIGIQVENDFYVEKKVYSIISTKPVIFKDNKFKYNKKNYTYCSYKNVRGDNYEKH